MRLQNKKEGARRLLHQGRSVAWRFLQTQYALEKYARPKAGAPHTVQTSPSGFQVSLRSNVEMAALRAACEKGEGDDDRPSLATVLHMYADNMKEAGPIGPASSVAVRLLASRYAGSSTKKGGVDDSSPWLLSSL